MLAIGIEVVFSSFFTRKKNFFKRVLFPEKKKTNISLKKVEKIFFFLKNYFPKNLFLSKCLLKIKKKCVLFITYKKVFMKTNFKFFKILYLEKKKIF